MNTITEGVSFDEETHTYRHDGLIVPSCTQIQSAFSNAYENVPPAVLARKAAIGTRVHAATELLDNGLEPEEDEQTKPYLDGYRDFIEKHKPNPLEMERRCIAFSDDMYGSVPYGMTLDRISEITVGGERKVYLLDIKTSAKPHFDAWGFQLAGYMNGLHGWEKHKYVSFAGIVHLRKDGSFKLYEIEWRDMLVAFNSAIYTYHFFKLGSRKSA